MNEVIYRVKRSFRYADRVYVPGEEFTPQGLRNDKTIIEHMCRVEAVKGSANASKRKQPSKNKPGLSGPNAQ